MAQRSIPFYFQSASHDCVPACVMAIADFYQVSIALHEIRSLLVTDPVKGTVIKHMQNLGEYFQVKLGRITDLSQLPQYLPFIAYLNEQHAVVVWRTVDGKTENFQIGDPGEAICAQELAI